MEKLRNYRWGINTEVLYMGEWQKVREVWFEEEKIGLKESGHLIDYSEVKDIRR
jgi:hypothetical protein